MQEGSLFSTSSPAFIIYRLFGDGHSDLCEVILHCSFHLPFSNSKWCWASFHLFISHLDVFFGEVSIYAFCPLLVGLFVFLMLSCMSCLYILEISPLSVATFAVIFSYSEGCLFILFMVSFAVQKLLSLIRSMSPNLDVQVEWTSDLTGARYQKPSSLTFCRK